MPDAQGRRSPIEIREFIDAINAARDEKETRERNDYIAAHNLREKAKAMSNDVLYAETFWAAGAEASEQSGREEQWEFQVLVNEFITRLVVADFITPHAAVAYLSSIGI